MRGAYWSAYLTPPPDMTHYPAGGTVVDVGCGEGHQLGKLREAGYHAIGLEIAPEPARACWAAGHAVMIGRAEHLPFRSESCHGVLCKVVLPYTDERRAIEEIARVLTQKGVALLYVHGLGYSLRYLLRPDSWKHSVYAARTIVNTVVYRLSGRRLPGFLGDTIFQSDRTLRRYYRSAGLTLLSTIPSGRFFGQPVFIGHVLRK